MSVEVKNTFIEAKPGPLYNYFDLDPSEVINPWRRSVTAPDTGGTGEGNTPGKQVTAYKENDIMSRSTTSYDPLEVCQAELDLNKLLSDDSCSQRFADRLNEDVSWQRLTTDCSWDEFLNPLYGDPVGGSAEIALPFVPMAPVFYPTMQACIESPKAKPQEEQFGFNDHHFMDIDDPLGEWKNTVTVMIKNLNYRVTQQTVLDDLKAKGFDNMFDFFYLPIDSETNRNRGYAFVNFLSPTIAKRFKQMYDGDNHNLTKAGKPLQITPATLQGYAANYAHYSAAVVQRGHHNSRPLFLRMPPHEDQCESLNVALDQKLAPCSPKPKAKRSGRRGRSLIDKAVEAVEKQRLETEQAGGQFCHQCGNKAMQNFKFCTFCGAALSVNRTN